MTCRVKDIPEDIYDRFAMYDMQLEDLYLPVATANPVSLVLHILQWLLLAPLFTTKDESDSVLRSTPSRKGVGGRWERWEDEGKTSKIGLGGGWTVSCRLKTRARGLSSDFHRHCYSDNACVWELHLSVHQV